MNAELEKAVERMQAKVNDIKDDCFSFADEADVKTLLKAVREMGEDSKRLDWLASFCLLNVYNTSGHCKFSHWQKEQPIRKAIDAAMSNTKEGEKV